MDRNTKKAAQKIDFATTRSERFTYGLYFVGQLIFYCIITGYLQLYLTDSGIPATVVGAIFAVAKVWDAVNDPLFGIFVDKVNFKKGKYIPWVRISTFLIPAATVLIFAMPSSASLQVKTIWASVGYLLWDISYTFCDVPIFALATAMTDNIKERDWLFMTKGFVTMVGGLFTLIAVPLLYPEIGWTATAVILSVIGIITMIPVGYRAKERYVTKPEKEPSIKDLLSYLVKNKYLLIFSGAMIVGALTNTTAAVNNYVAIYCFGDARFMATMTLVATAPILVSIIVVQQLIKTIDKLAIYLVSTVISLVFSVVMYFVGYKDVTLYLVLCFFKFLFTSGASVLAPMFTADCAEYGYFVTGDRAQGVAFSIQTFTAKMIAALSTSIGMFVLGMVGFVEGEGAVQTQSTIDWIWSLSAIFPVISGVAAFFIILFAYKLKTSDVELMVKAREGEITRDEAIAGFSRKYV
ncbi:MAG: glycoside-pentoside-hexuronide (GPH):cation symporter [Clostridiales bacterium]|nr:glycoside-pentoside-hexuronide (GPH):cation symporter [Clostridiales bacterium]MDR2750900.1 glycoside-pentoside-hexuronide (GPH):cation symporter [Clostridiales bacterium]